MEKKKSSSIKRSVSIMLSEAQIRMLKKEDPSGKNKVSPAIRFIVKNYFNYLKINDAKK